MYETIDYPHENNQQEEDDEEEEGAYGHLIRSKNISTNQLFVLFTVFVFPPHQQ